MPANRRRFHPHPRNGAVWSATRLVLLSLVLTIGLVNSVRLQPARAAQGGALSQNRYLLVFETSRLMSRRTEGLNKAVKDLLDSGIQHHLRPGDSIGVWTFNSELHTGVFPLQQWSPANSEEVTGRVLSFLKEQKYGKSAKFESIIPALKHVVQNSRSVTVIVFTTGEDSISGTPEDVKINTFYKEWRKKQRDARMPFALVFIGRDQRLADCTLNTPPWELELPPAPSEPVVAKAPVLKTVVTNPVPSIVTSTAAPLIVSGRKPAAAASELPAARPLSSNAVAPNSGGLPKGPQAAAPQLPQLQNQARATAVTSAAPANVSTGTTGMARPAPVTPVALAPSQPKLARTNAAPSTNRTDATPASKPATNSVLAVASRPGTASAASPLVPAPVTQKHSFGKALIWAGLSLVVVALVSLGWFWRTRARRTPQTSFITRSLETKDR